MKQKDILIILILLFIFVITWIAGGIYHSAISSTISVNTNQAIESIDPNFDMKTINKLKSREKIDPSFDLEVLSPTPIVLPTLSPFPNASQEGALLL